MSQQKNKNTNLDSFSTSQYQNWDVGGEDQEWNFNSQIGYFLEKQIPHVGEIMEALKSRLQKA